MNRTHKLPDLCRTNIIAPSILASDFTNLRQECNAVLNGGADWLHVDVMDGHFVPNITIGVPVVAALRRNLPGAFLDVHLMIDAPSRYIEAFASAGANMITVHVEATHHLHRTLQAIRDAGVYAGVSLNPATPLSSIAHVYRELDLILIMSVNPGFGGQAFIDESLNKIRSARQEIDSRGLNIALEVDGGVKTTNIASISEAGANVFVAGSAIFKAAQPYVSTISEMRALLKPLKHNI